MDKKLDVESVKNELQVFLTTNNCFESFIYNLANCQGSRVRDMDVGIVFNAYVKSVVGEYNGYYDTVSAAKAILGELINYAFTWDMDTTRDDGQAYWSRLSHNWKATLTSDLVSTKLMEQLRYKSIWQ